MRPIIDMLKVALAVVLIYTGVGALLPSSSTIERSVIVRRPVAEVWGWVSDFGRWPKWYAVTDRNNLASVDFTPPPSGPAGGALRWSYARGESRATIRTWIENQEISFEMTSDTWGMTRRLAGWTDRVTLSPFSPNETRVTWTMRYRTKGTFSKLVNLVTMEKMFLRSVASNLDHLKAAAEAPPGNV